MKRTTIFIDEPLERDLRALAEREGRPKASLVREAIREYLVRRAGSGGGIRFVAAGRSGRRDVAERHEELLWEGDGTVTDGGRQGGGPASGEGG